MTKDEALQMCLEYIETDAHERKYVRHAIKAALEAKDKPWEKFCDSHCVWTDHHPDCKLAKDEPVAWMRTSGTGSPVVTEALLVEMPEMRWNFQQPLYTTQQQRKPLTDEQPEVRTGNCLRVGVCASEGHKIQPQRTWVGLTDEEKQEIYKQADKENWHDQPLLETVEAKLKEKNT